MLDSLKTPLVLVGRILIAFMFMQAGYEKLTDLTGTAAYIASGGLPNSTVLAGLSGVFELVAGLAILIGFKARWAALVLAGQPAWTRANRPESRLFRSELARSPSGPLVCVLPIDRDHHAGRCKHEQYKFHWSVLRLCVDSQQCAAAACQSACNRSCSFREPIALRHHSQATTE